MRALRLAALCVLALGPGCTSESEPTAAVVEPVTATVGVHRVQFVPPDRWERQDHGREQRFERGSEQISLADLGPFARRGYEREVLASRALSEAGQAADARQQLDGIDLRAAFPTLERWRDVEESWERIRRERWRGRPVPPEELVSDYDRVLTAIGTLADADMPTLAERALARIGEDERRDVAEQHAVAIDGRPAWVVDSWDRLNHTGRRRHLFVLNEGNLLAARMESGQFVRSEVAFERLVASLGFRDGLPQRGSVSAPACGQKRRAQQMSAMSVDGEGPWQARRRG